MRKNGVKGRVGDSLKFESLNIERQAIVTLVKGMTLGSWGFRAHSKGLGGGRNKWEGPTECML